MDDKRRIEILERRLEMSNKYWLRAAKKALEGDTKDLWLRVQLAEAPYEGIVLS